MTMKGSKVSLNDYWSKLKCLTDITHELYFQKKLKSGELSGAEVKEQNIKYGQAKKIVQGMKHYDHTKSLLEKTIDDIETFHYTAIALIQIAQECQDLNLSHRTAFYVDRFNSPTTIHYMLEYLGESIEPVITDDIKIRRKKISDTLDALDNNASDDTILAYGGHKEEVNVVKTLAHVASNTKSNYATQKVSETLLEYKSKPYLTSLCNAFDHVSEYVYKRTKDAILTLEKMFRLVTDRINQAYAENKDREKNMKIFLDALEDVGFYGDLMIDYNTFFKKIGRISFRIDDKMDMQKIMGTLIQDFDIDLEEL